jgi:glycosyltransferase involved in cell wall biosynthesis
MQDSITVRAYYPNFFSDGAIAQAALRIVKYFNGGRVRADVMGLCSNKTLREFKKRSRGRPIYRDAIPPGIVWAIARRVLSTEQINAFAEWRFLSGLKDGDIAYFWPGASLDLHRKAKARGCLIVSERVNTLLHNSIRILDAEFEALGIPPVHGLTQEESADELACMAYSDFIFSPSPGVTESILDAGISKDRILETSYGLERRECLDIQERSPAGRRVTALFAGRICVRKGIPLLLKAWDRAAVDARLVIVGRIAPEIETLFRSAIRDRPDIEYREHVEDLEPLYRDADLFILPSLEEGSPLVSYLALGAKLPMLVSPMGGGGIVEADREGLVIDPHDEEGFAAAIRAMVKDEAMRARMAAAAGEKARYYTWDLVAGRRREALLESVAARAARRAQ